MGYTEPLTVEHGKSNSRILTGIPRIVASGFALFYYVGELTLMLLNMLL